MIIFNKIKDELVIPDFMQHATITSFYKGRGVKGDMASQRGIFCVSKMRSLLDKLLYADYYDFVDENLGDSNVGGRKNRNIRDHIFVLNSVVNDVINGEADDVEIQSTDITKCFDELNYEETHNDLWDVFSNDDEKDDKFHLVAKLDEEVSVNVKKCQNSSQNG